MVVRVYVSGISGNKEVKKRQQRVAMILDSKSIKYDLIDITEPGKENEKEFMQENSKTRDSKHPLPPQIFNDDRYCGDYEDFDMANELDELEKFLNSSSSGANNNTSNNGIINGSSESEKNDSFSVKEDLRESPQENLETVYDSESDAVLDMVAENIPNEVVLIDDENESVKSESDEATDEARESVDVTSTEE